MTPDPVTRTGAAAAREPRGAGPGPATAPYILVVDDEAVVRDFLTRCLERAGYTVKQAGSAAEALEIMVLAPATAVLCDIRMPGQDGLWLAARLRAHWPGTPVVMVTGIDDVETVRQSRDLGAVDYISKPIKPEQLVAVLRRVTNVTKEEPRMSDEAALPGADPHSTQENRADAEYTLESPVRCPACGERISTLKAVRLIRGNVNFTSTLPRRGRVIACPVCLAVIPAELTNF